MSNLTIYSASAGSGKTYTLTQEYLKLVIEYPKNYKHVMAVTFTNKATDEMKSRIVSELSKLASGSKSAQLEALKAHTGLSSQKITENAQTVLNNILHNYSCFGVSTIDSFFQKIIRSFIKELGIKGGFKLELNQFKVLEAIVEQLFDSIGKNKNITSWVLDYVKKRIESGKSWDVQNNLKQFAKAIIDEEFKLIEKDGFSNNNLDELKIFVNRLEVYNNSYIEDLSNLAQKFFKILENNALGVDDFSSKTSGVAGFFLKLRDKQPYKLGAKVRLAEENSESWVTKTHRNREAIINLVDIHLRPILKEILDYIKLNEEAYYTNQIILDNIYIYGVYNDLVLELKSYRDENNLLLLSDITELLDKIIGNNHAPFIYEKVGNHYHHFLIDEFQDTSRMQWSNFKPLIENNLSQGYKNLLVGDVKQAIYRWRGGDWKLLLNDVEKDLKPYKVNKKILESNYRSAKDIVAFNNLVFKQGVHELSKYYDLSIEKGVEQCNSNIKKESLKVFKEQLAQNFNKAYNAIEQNAEQKFSGSIKIHFKSLEKQEKYWDKIQYNLLQEIDALLNMGGIKKNISILVRNGYESALISDLLNTENKVQNNKYSFITSSSFKLRENNYIKLIICTLNYILYPDDKINIFNAGYLHNLINGGIDNAFFDPAYHLSQKERLEGLPSELIDHRAHLSKLPIYELCQRIINLYKLSQKEGALDFLQTFQDYVLFYCRNNNPDILSFLEWWQQVGADKSPMISEDQDAIKIMTIHKSKGLQFDHVIVPFCDWGLHHDAKKGIQIWGYNQNEGYSDFPYLPIKFKQDLIKSNYSWEYYQELQNAALENFNILYVAQTRAVRSLCLLCPMPADQSSKTIENLSVNDLLWKIANNQLIEFLTDSVLEMGALEIDNESKMDEAQTYEIEYYPTINFREKIEISHLSDKFLLEASPGKIGKINTGIILHDILSRIEKQADISAVLSQMVYEGAITNQQIEGLQKQLDGYFKNPVFASWYCGRGQILNEQTILVPGQKHDRRPDRIIIKENRVVVIDFKFGEHKSQGHIKQINRYSQLIKEMGYKEVSAFLFYGDNGEVVDINNNIIQTELF